MAGALHGKVVADFSHVMAGPYASHLLRLLGAEVVKVEAPGTGDPFRTYGADRRYDGMAPAFIGVNAGKKSLVLNLKHEPAREAALRLAARADVVLENFRPGVMARFGLDHESVRALQPSVIYCSISGYGQDGPRRDWPAIDNIVQATSGMMALTGEPSAGPMRVGFPVVDTLTGQTAALAILAALLRREQTGEGEYIDVAMFDASLAFMTSAVVPYLVTGQLPQQTGNVGYSGQPTAGVFAAADGRLISLGVVQQAQFEALAREVGRSQWLHDARFATPDLRRQNGGALQAELGEVFGTKNATDWEARLSAAGIPCGVVRDVGEAMSLEGMDARGITVPVRIAGLPDRQDVAVVGAGFISSKGVANVDAAPPRHGEHSGEVLAWLGYGDEERRAILAGNGSTPRQQ